MAQGQVFLKRGLALFQGLSFPHLEFTLQSHHQPQDAADIGSKRLVRPAADDGFVICRHVRVEKCLCCQIDL